MRHVTFPRWFIILLLGRGVPRSDLHDTDGTFLWLLRSPRWHPPVPELAVVRNLRTVQLRGYHDRYIRPRQAKARVQDPVLPPQVCRNVPRPDGHERRHKHLFDRRGCAGGLLRPDQGVCLFPAEGEIVRKPLVDDGRVHAYFDRHFPFLSRYLLPW